MGQGETTAFSTPGKALLAGGYLVLNPQFKAFVVALSARMHAVVSSSIRPQLNGIEIKVTSAQFNNDQWNYRISKKGGFVPIQIDSGKHPGSNPFLEQVIFNVFSYYSPDKLVANYIKIDIFSDAAYHSDAGSKVKCNKHMEFNFHDKDIKEVPKTGLGSSAGLTTVTTAALCDVLSPVTLNVTNPSHLRIIHNLAQISHCQAQGKIGSGFDVAAATYGSIIYRRFPPEIIANLPVMNLKFPNQYHRALITLVDRIDWNIFTKPVKLPPGLKLVMGDVHNGSETVKLVAKVNEWYQANLPRSLDIYEDLNKNNMKVIEILDEFNALYETDETLYNEMIFSFQKRDFPLIQSLRDTVSNIRQILRQITKESGADIEPPEQTKLLDACLEMRGVITGVVPGAGGHDAIALLVTVNTDMDKLKMESNELNSVTWMKLKQADMGLKQEDPLFYQNLEYK